jgi:hypothetical protein
MRAKRFELKPAATPLQAYAEVDILLSLDPHTYRADDWRQESYRDFTCGLLTACSSCPLAFCKRR